ncbi:unnamed protein product [Anisakis simplex]|uniref:Uncharacterized protein n=1 Tax=Anisakis simplex TaxID=6269 RepID=A0A0M3K6T0_ANISI|nr:unnamed protein product [Anisakis simplex]
MGPSPVDNDIPMNNSDAGRQNSSSDEDYERDGWHIGYEVEMNGIGTLIDNGSIDSIETSSFTGSDSDATDADSDSRYAGYEALPTAASEVRQHPDAQQYLSTVSAVPMSVHQQFEEALSEAPEIHLKDSDIPLEHQPQPIELDEGT